METKQSRHIGYAVLTLASAGLAIWAWFALATAPYPWIGGPGGLTSLLGLAMLAAFYVFYKGTTDLSLAVSGWAGACAGFGALILAIVYGFNPDGHGNYGVGYAARWVGLLCIAVGLLPAPAAAMGAQKELRLALWLAFLSAFGFFIGFVGFATGGPYHLWTGVGDFVGTFAYAAFAVILAWLCVSKQLGWPKVGAFAYME